MEMDRVGHILLQTAHFPSAQQTIGKRSSCLQPFSLGFFLSSPRIRLAGIRGIQGVVRKTVNDELQATIWEPQHMDKIVPSLLFNMHKIEDIDR